MRQTAKGFTYYEVRLVEICHSVTVIVAEQQAA